MREISHLLHLNLVMQVLHFELGDFDDQNKLFKPILRVSLKKTRTHTISMIILKRFKCKKCDAELISKDCHKVLILQKYEKMIKIVHRPIS